MLEERADRQRKADEAHERARDEKENAPHVHGETVRVLRRLGVVAVVALQLVTLRVEPPDQPAVVAELRGACLIRSSSPVSSLHYFLLLGALALTHRVFATGFLRVCVRCRVLAGDVVGVALRVLGVPVVPHA